MNDHCFLNICSKKLFFSVAELLFFDFTRKKGKTLILVFLFFNSSFFKIIFYHFLPVTTKSTGEYFPFRPAINAHFCLSLVNRSTWVSFLRTASTLFMGSNIGETKESPLGVFSTKSCFFRIFLNTEATFDFYEEKSVSRA